MASAANELNEEEWRRLLGDAGELVGSLAVLDGGVADAGGNERRDGEALKPVRQDLFAADDGLAIGRRLESLSANLAQPPETKTGSRGWVAEVAESVRVLRGQGLGVPVTAGMQTLAATLPASATVRGNRGGQESRAEWLPAVVTGLVAPQASGITSGSVTANDGASASAQSWLSAIPTGGLASVSGGGRPLWESLIVPPFVSGLLRLFGGGEDTPPPMPQPYQLPKAVQLEGALERNGRVRTDLNYDAAGLPRAAEARSTGSGPTVQVNVQAMDSRSFLDHSEEIARSVRQALWESQVLHDALREV